ncbi:MAG TPA: hypothetical protein ENK01_01460, partial [Hellea balneolensis]|nr:hypothetical protein [Hellea balneolensis]
MTIKLKLATLFTASLLLFGLPGCAKAQSGVDTANRAEVEQIVKSYILEHPEIIEQALDNLKEKRDRESILAVGDEIWHDKRDASYGPKNAKVTMVEFFDYNCSFCKHSSSWVRSVLDAHPKDVRVIFKELPILDRRTRTSRKAARAALAAARQGKYKEMHFALMGANGLSDAFIEKTA